MIDSRAFRAATALAVGLLLAAPLAPRPADAEAAAPGTALLFDPGQLAGIAPGGGLVYSHSRSVPAGARLPAIDGGEVRVDVAGSAEGAKTHVRLEAAGATRRLDPFPVASGNPVFVVFLESALRAVAEATGGSIFYLRNRMKEALWKGVEPEAVTASYDGASVAAERVVFRPFAADPNVAGLGVFREMELAFVLSDEVPGRFISLVAATAPGESAAYREEIRLVEEVTP